MGTPSEPTPREQLLLFAVMALEVLVASIFVTIALVALT
jgi:hypothetical protein